MNCSAVLMWYIVPCCVSFLMLLIIEVEARALWGS
jgi:hypothetical protein